MLKKIYKEIFFYLKSIFIIMFLFNSSATSSYEKKLYDIKIKSINGSYINLSDYKGKVILLVNVASYCGFTKKY